MVRQAARDLREQVVVAGAQPRDRRLEQVAEAVQLMPRLQVGVPGGLPGPPEAGVQVAVRLLGGGDPRGQGVGSGPPGRRSSLAAQFPGHGLEQLVDLGVDELDAGVAAGDGAGRGAVEVAGPADALHPRLAVPEDRVGVQPLLLSARCRR